MIEATGGKGCLMDIKELSQKIGVSVNTIYDWCAFGRIPHNKLGKLLRFDPDKINKWLVETQGKYREN